MAGCQRPARLGQRALHPPRALPRRCHPRRHASTDEAQAQVEAVVKELTKAGIKAHGIVRSTIYGYAAREIVEGAKDLDVGVIIMGSRGRGDLAGLVLGSTAHKVIHLADRPVLVVR
jgi:nucleotide-binding universal stress UspA family protein